MDVLHVPCIHVKRYEINQDTRGEFNPLLWVRYVFFEEWPKFYK